ncbi:DUF4352 domain-containing protein [Streptomyces sp. NPDC056387]|uniref:DUF4352 domain-containing protein n=1 Tax=Streptomyces sp. NPDC056387 TaxID=3345803 RepID=UPI0035E0F9B4
MRTHHIATILAAAAALALTGCNDPSIKTKPDANPPALNTPAVPSSAAPKPQTAAVGSTLTLKGTKDGEQVAVTVVKWADPVKASNDFSKPKDGFRYVAAQLRLENTGNVPYDDSPGNGTQLADDQGQQFTATFTGGITAGPEFPGSVKLAPGAKGLGYVVFEVPTDAKVATLHFALNSGFADQTGQWDIK